MRRIVKTISGSKLVIVQKQKLYYALPDWKRVIQNIQKK